MDKVCDLISIFFRISSKLQWSRNDRWFLHFYGDNSIFCSSIRKDCICHYIMRSNSSLTILGSFLFEFGEIINIRIDWIIEKFAIYNSLHAIFLVAHILRTSVPKCSAIFNSTRLWIWNKLLFSSLVKFLLLYSSCKIL